MKLARKTPAKKAPTKKKAAAKKIAPKKKVARRVDEDDEDEDEDGPGERVGMATSGWGGAKEMGSSDFIKNLDFKNEAEMDGKTRYFIGKFMDEEPYANVKIHWLNDRKGKRSFICVGDDCPLCEVGADVKAEFRFNFAVFTDGDPILRSWSAGWKIYRKIESLAQSRLTSPLPRRIYLATRTGEKFNEIQYDVARINEDEIADSYPDIYVPSAEEIEALTGYTLDDVKKEYSTMEELEEIAAEIIEGE